MTASKSARDGVEGSVASIQDSVKRKRGGQRTHGMTSTGTYISWGAMVARCTNPRLAQYKFYGGAGVTVCERWRHFNNFLADMGERPEGTSLDRWPDKFGNYELGNCRWATPRQQSQNIRTNRNLEYQGEILCLSEWARRVGVHASTLRKRINAGQPIERILRSAA